MSTPNFYNVSISTAVYTVKCKDPDNLAPLRGWEFPNSCLQDMSPGIST